MKKTLIMAIFLILFAVNAQAYYKCEPNSATNEILYYASIRQDGFSKFTVNEFGKVVKKDGSAVYYVIPKFVGFSAKKYLLSDSAELIIDDIPYGITKDTSAMHIGNRHHLAKNVLISEYAVPAEVAEKIKGSKGVIKLHLAIEGKEEKTLNYGLKTSDEIRFIVDRTFDDFFAVSKKELVPQYTQIEE